MTEHILLLLHCAGMCHMESIALIQHEIAHSFTHQPDVVP